MSSTGLCRALLSAAAKHLLAFAGDAVRCSTSSMGHRGSGSSRIALVQALKSVTSPGKKKVGSWQTWCWRRHSSLLNYMRFGRRLKRRHSKVTRRACLQRSLVGTEGNIFAVQLETPHLLTSSCEGRPRSTSYVEYHITKLRNRYRSLVHCVTSSL